LLHYAGPGMKGPFFRARKLLTDQIPTIDAHIHTSLTDGYSSLEDYVLKARELGLSAIAFTEHAGNTSTWFEEYAGSKERLQQLAGPVRVYLGAEVKLTHPDGKLNLDGQRIAKMDFVVGVLHRYPDAAAGYLSFKNLDPKEAMDIDYRLSLALVANPMVDVFGHPAGVYSFYFGKYHTGRLHDLIAFAASNGRVIEINSNPRYRHVFPIILETCLELDCTISIGSDAHTVDELGHVVSFLRESIKTSSRRKEKLNED